MYVIAIKDTIEQYYTGVDLVDVLEMIVNCVCAGMARSGEVRGLEISDDILRKALNNTVDLIKASIMVKDR